MDLFIDLDGRTLLKSRTSADPLSRLTLVQGDAGVLHLRFFTRTGSANGVAQTTLPSWADTIVLGARSQADMEEDGLLFSGSDFVLNTDDAEDPYYESVLNMNTAPLAAIFTGAEKRDHFALLDIEIANTGNTARDTVVAQFDTRILRHIYRGTEGVPLTGDPVYPAPGVIVNFLANPTRTATFTDEAIWTHEHNLGRYVTGVSVLDADGNHLGGNVSQPDMNTIVVTHGAPTTGTLIYT